MEKCNVKISEKYDIQMMEYLYDTTRFFSVKTWVDMSKDDFDFDKHTEDLLFYKGVLAHNSKNNQITRHIFQEKKVFMLSDNCDTNTLFYVTSSDDYKEISFYKRHLKEEHNQHILTFDIDSVNKANTTDPLDIHHFYALNDQYALISYKTIYEKLFKFAIIDSITKKLIVITNDVILRRMEYMIGCTFNNKKHLVIKTGEHMVHERKCDWENNREETEELIVVGVEDFIMMVKNNNLNLKDDIIFSSKINEAISNFIVFNNKINILIQCFDSKNSVVIEYDFEQKITKRVTYSSIYNTIYNLKDKLYATTKSKNSTTLYDLQKNLKIDEFQNPQRVIAILEEGILTTDGSLGSEDKRIYLHVNNNSTILVDIHCFLDRERDLILVIEQD